MCYKVQGGLRASFLSDRLTGEYHMRTRSFLGRCIPPLLVSILICAMSIGYGLAQSSNPVAANRPKNGLFVNKAPEKQPPMEAPATSAPSDRNTADSNKPAAQPAPPIKIPPVRITIGAPNNRRTPPPTIQISPQDIAKVQKIMELINIGRKSGR